MHVPIVLPVKPHIQQFIINRYGDGVSHEIAVRKLTFLGDMISLALRKNPFMSTSFKAPAGPCLIFYFYTETKFMEVPKDELRQLQIALDRHFRDSLIMFVMGYHYATGDQMRAVKKFLDEHGIDEDSMSPDTAWKIWRDFEVKKERIRTKSFRKDVGVSGKLVGEFGNSSVNYAMS